MPLSSEIAKSLGYLRKRYGVSEPDLVALARKLSIQEDPEESWEEITQRYLTQKRKRHAVNLKR